MECKGAGEADGCSHKRTLQGIVIMEIFASGCINVNILVLTLKLFFKMLLLGETGRQGRKDLSLPFFTTA